MIRSRFQTGAALLLAASLVSCATPGDPSLDQARGRVFQTRRTYLEGAGVGAAAGTAVGAGIGALIGQQSKQPAAGALIGAGAGAVIGTVGGLLYAQHVVNQRRQYASASAYLEACTRIAAEQHASISHYNATLRQRRASIVNDREFLRAEIEGSRKVLARLKSEIELQNSATAQARAENVSPAYLEAHAAQLAALEADDRNLTAEIERLSATENSLR